MTTLAFTFRFCVYLFLIGINQLEDQRAVYGRKKNLNLKSKKRGEITNTVNKTKWNVPKKK